MPSPTTKSESRKIDRAVADIMAIIAFAKREHAAKAKKREAPCTSTSNPPKSPERAAA